MNAMAIIDPLFCQEEPFLLEQESVQKTHSHSEAEDSRDLLSSLLQNERQTHHHHHFPPTSPQNPFLQTRKDSILRIQSACARFRFNPLTLFLAVNYLDRCFLSPSGGGLTLQTDKPWMNQLSSAACLSLAAKVEETHVPSLLDLQLHDGPGPNGPNGPFVFEPKTVRRMELLVLSALGWRMNPATPLCFISCVLTGDDDDADVTGRCERALLSVLSDWRWVQFAPSEWASAALVYSMGEDNAVAVEELLHVSKERVGDCVGVIREVMGGDGRKRKRGWLLMEEEEESEPLSPDRVVGACFSYESSSSSLDSWGTTMWPSPPPPPFKRTKTKYINE